MKYILSFLIFFTSLFLNTGVFAVDLQSKISSIWYEWNLSKSTIINIKWENLDKCNILNINWKKVDVTKKDKSLITFIIWDNYKYDWIVKLDCTNIKLERQYNFPYIDNVSWLNNTTSNRQITIIWHNFSKLPNITVKWWNFSKVFAEDRMIVWLLPVKIDNNELYITSNWLKSNIFNLDVKIPKINYIFSSNWFTKNWNILVYGDNLNEYNNSKLYFWTKIISTFTYNKKDSYISFPAELIEWKAALKILSNWFESNSLEIKVANWKPIIESTSVKSSMIEASWKIVQKNFLVLNTKNLPNNLKTITIYNNKVVIPKYTIINNDIYIELNKFWYWNNFIQLELYWDKSNIYNFKNESRLPNLVSLEIMNTDKNIRNIQLFIQDFNIREDKIFLNGKENKVQSCVSNICKIQIADTILKWTISVWKWNIKNSKVLNFDITKEKYTWKTPLLLSYKIYNNDWLAKNNTDIDLKWLLFKNTDILTIWKDTVVIKFIDSNNIRFKIPSNIEAWEYEMSLKTKEWVISNKLKIIVTKNSKSQVTVDKLKIEKSDFDINTVNTWAIYSISLENKLEDMILKNINFKVENYKKESYLSTFKLKIWNTEYDSTSISNNWIINFNWRFELPRSANNHTISLIKDSNYINTETFNVNFIKDNFEIEKVIDWTTYKTVVFWTFWNNTIKIINNDKYINCKDSKSDNTNCNKVLKIIPVKVEAKVVEPVKSNTKTPDIKNVEIKTTEIKK